MWVESEELGLLLGPEDSEVVLRQSVGMRGGEKAGRIFDMFSSKGQSEHLAASRVRWRGRGKKEGARD